MYWNVAPVNRSLFGNLSPATSTSFSRTIAYTDFHSGNLGPHTYTVTKTSGGAWLTITGNGTSSITLSGTTPGSAETTTLSIACTNAIGQTTTITRTIAVGGATASTTTWDATKLWTGAGALPTLSNGNRTANGASDTNDKGAFSTNALSSGKYYIEFYIDTQGAGNGVGVGIRNSNTFAMRLS